METQKSENSENLGSGMGVSVGLVRVVGWYIRYIPLMFGVGWGQVRSGRVVDF